MIIKEEFIDAAIKNAVNNLGHVPVDVKQFQLAQGELKVKNQELQNKNQQLKQTLNQITNATTSIK